MITSYLREYVEFCSSMSYATAAARLYLAQPTLRAHIKALEEEVGAALVAKRDRELVLTPTGKLLLQKAREVVGFTDRALEECREYAVNNSSLTVGDTGCPALLYAVEEARDAYLRRHPEVSIEISLSQKTSSNLDAVRNGEVDLILLTRVREPGQAEPAHFAEGELPEGFRWALVKESRLLLWVDARNPLFDAPAIAPADLDGMEFLVGDSENMRRAGEAVKTCLHGHGADVVVGSRPFENYAEYYFWGSERTFGLSIAETSAPRRGIRFFELDEVPLPCDLVALFNEKCLRKDGDAFFSTLVESLKRSL